MRPWCHHEARLCNFSFWLCELTLITAACNWSTGSIARNRYKWIAIAAPFIPLRALVSPFRWAEHESIFGMHGLQWAKCTRFLRSLYDTKGTAMTTFTGNVRQNRAVVYVASICEGAPLQKCVGFMYFWSPRTSKE